MVTIDQVCWNEMNLNDELTLRCTDPELRGYEGYLRRTLFQWRHFPVDMVVDAFVRVGKAVHNTGFGVRVEESTAVTDPTNSVVGHLFTNQFQTEDDLAKVKQPRISHDQAETDRRLAVAPRAVRWAIGGSIRGGRSLSLPVGPDQHLDERGSALYGLADRPEYMHRLVGLVTDGYMAMLDQLEDQGLVCGRSP